MCTASPATNAPARATGATQIPRDDRQRAGLRCVLTCASRTGGAGAVHRLGLCQALETKSSVGHSQTQCRCALCTRTLHTRARSQRPVPRDHAARALHVTGRSAAAGRSPGHIFRDTLMWRLVTLTLVGGMSRLRVRDSRLSAVSLSPLSLSRSRRHRLRTQTTRRLASPSRVTLTSRVRISHRAVKPPRRAAACM